CRAPVAGLALLLALGCRGSEPAPADTTADADASESQPGTTALPESSDDEKNQDDEEDEEETETAETGDTSGPFDPTPTDVLVDLGCDPAIPEDSDARWQLFLAMRENWLYVLSDPILACVAQQDTQHP